MMSLITSKTCWKRIKIPQVETGAVIYMIMNDTALSALSGSTFIKNAYFSAKFNNDKFFQHVSKKNNKAHHIHRSEDISEHNA